jgi:hypothetical protein
MLDSGSWSGWKQSCCTQGRGLVVNNHAVLMLVDWLETIMLHSGLWSGWKQSCCTEGCGVVGNNRAVLRVVEWL